MAAWRQVGTNAVSDERPMVDVLFQDGKMTVLEPRRCHTCRWWRRPTNEEGFAPCQALAIPSDAEDFATGAYAEAVDGGDSRFMTAADFGCVQWESSKA